MDKTVNVFAYKPGHGGHFISFLFSLDPSTSPWLPDNGNYTAENCPRKEMYSFKNLLGNHSHWQHHHLSFGIGPGMLKRHISSFDFPIINYPTHPLVFYKFNVSEILESVTTNYLRVTLSPELEYVNDKFKLSNNGFPTLLNNENSCDQKYTDAYSPFEISFDNFVLGEETFVHEYQRINKHLNLRDYLDDALELYRDWYEARNFKQFLLK